MVPNAPLTWFLETHDGLPVLVVAGSLDEASSELFYRGVTAVMRRHAAGLLIDVAAVSVAAVDCMTVFTRVMAEARRWPPVRVLVCAPSAEAAPCFSAGPLDPRLLFASVAAARAAVQVDVPTVVEDLLPVSGAARRARDVITEACLRWDEPGLIGSAALVASELVTNAAVHAHTMMSMTLLLQLCHLHIAVIDGSTRPAVHRRPDAHRLSGRGMHVVDDFSAVWGSTSLPAGKVVWSVLDRQYHG